MGPFAITYPQLIGQALQLKRGHDELARLRTSYDLAERIADGLYRSQGSAFINHLVRTASIVMAYGSDIDTVVAAMHHSAYILDVFQHSRRRRAGPQRRAYLSAVLGGEVETIIWEYSQHKWGDVKCIAEYLERLPSYGPVMKAVLFIRLANELDDFAELTALYRPGYPYRRKIESYGDKVVAIAYGLDLRELGDAIKEAYEATLSARLPASVIRESTTDAYEMPRKHFAEKNSIEYFLSRVWRRLK